MKKKVLLVGESWISSATHYKGFDQFGSVTFHLGAEPLVKALAEDAMEHAQVGGIVSRNVTNSQNGLVLLTGEVGRRGDHQGHRLVGHLAVGVHLTGVADPDLVFSRSRSHPAVVRDSRGGETGVERGRVVGLSPTHSER